MATKWTKEKEDIILQEVKNNPEHLRLAFKIAAKKINKTPQSVCTRYYNVINKKRQSLNNIAKFANEDFWHGEEYPPSIKIEFIDPQVIGDMAQLAERQKDLDPEFNKIVNDNFDELLCKNCDTCSNIEIEKDITKNPVRKIDFSDPEVIKQFEEIKKLQEEILDRKNFDPNFLNDIITI